MYLKLNTSWKVCCRSFSEHAVEKGQEFQEGLSMGIRPLERKDFREIMAVLEESYRTSPSFFIHSYPNLWREDRMEYGNGLVLEEKGKIVSHVGIFPLTLLVENVEINVARVGGVATLPEFRKRGYFKKLMEYAIQKMELDGFPVSILWGDRQRYGNFGYELAGQTMVFEVSQRSIAKTGLKTSGLKLLRFSSEREDALQSIMHSYNCNPLRAKRSEEDFLLIFNKPFLSTLVGEKKGKFAYLSFLSHITPPKIVECGGEPEVLLAIMDVLMKEADLESIQISVPPYPNRLFWNLLEASSTWRIEPLGMIKILNLSRTIKSYSPIIERRARELGLKGSLTLEMVAGTRTERITLCLDPTISFRSKESKQKICLSEREMVRLLFGPSNVPQVNRCAPLLCVSCLPLYIGFLDRA